MSIIRVWGTASRAPDCIVRSAEGEGMQATTAVQAGPTLRAQFLLDPDVVFLNHGSYGACPRPVFEVYQEWQRELERQPVEFLVRRSDGLLDYARARIGAYVNAAADDVVFASNATSALNVIARSLPLQAGDEILSTDLEYGALDLTWDWLCGKIGARYLRHPIALPVASADDIVESLWSAVTPRTRAIFLSHITSNTALIMPLAEICRRAREAGILTIVDGAHATSQIPIDVQALGIDIYAGNCHKWLCAPKGSAFLYVRPEHQSFVESLTISWGWRPGHTFVTRNQWQGTRDIAAFLSVPAAIDFQAVNDWDSVRARCHNLASDALRRLTDLFGLEPLSPNAPEWFSQMVAVPLPTVDPVELKERLYNSYGIEIPIGEHNGQQTVRISVQGYNTAEDLDALVDALRTELDGQ